ncbi:neuronal acetylcholine receptor subunit non-alpha-2-like [Physella acuta]|uniref:neuronal acetylcholine receptor subunit non-alpha-2-like n=1 Tax=Physella acuta TaxID=109671 RepID=UPI0027DB4EB3|nr:neuronal acetylcholine receptor subunit non-alpha-2-like [Physella acuta]
MTHNVASQTTDYVADNLEQTTGSSVVKNLTVMEAFQLLRQTMLAKLTLRRKVPPKYYSEHNSSISLSFEPLQIVEVEGITQAVTLSSILTLTWNDPEVVWNPSVYSGIVDIKLSSENFWSPSIIIPKTTLGTDLHVPFPDVVDITYSGAILASVPTFVSTLCNLDMTYFPFDQHNCSFVFIEEHFYNMTSFRLPPTDIQSYFGTNGDWIMGKHGCVAKMSHISPNFQYVICNIEMSRRSIFYVINLIFPMAMTSVMTLAVFCIPAKSGEKIGFVLSMYTSTSVFLSYIVERVPKNMDKTLPRINILLLAIVVQVILATVATVFVLYRYKQQLTRKKRKESESTRSRADATTNNENAKAEKNSKNMNQKNQQNNIVSDFSEKEQNIKPKQISIVNNDVDSNGKNSSTCDEKCKNLNSKFNDKNSDPVKTDLGDQYNTKVKDEGGFWDRQLTHDELDTIFFVVLSLLTVLVYVIVYLY